MMQLNPLIPLPGSETQRDGIWRKSQSTFYEWRYYPAYPVAYERHFYNYHSGVFQSEDLKQLCTDSIWSNSELNTITYSVTNKPLLNETKLWSQNQWTNRTKINYTYNDNDLMSVLQTEIWQGEQWNNQSKVEYYYNAAGAYSSTYSYTWQNNQWEVQTRTEYFYNSYNLLEMLVISYQQQGQWTKSYSYVYLYNPANLISNLWVLVWDPAACDWTYWQVVEYSYNGANNIWRIVFFLWHNYYNCYIATDRYQYYYNQQQQLNQVLFSYYLDDPGLWLDSFRYIYSYDDNGNRISELVEESNGASFFSYRRYDHVYDYVGNQDESIPASALRYSLAPNPFTDNLTLSVTLEKSSGAIVSVFNTKGQCLKSVSIPLKGNEQTDWIWNGRDNLNKEVPSGLYIIRISIPGQRNTSLKTIKLKR